MPRTVITVAEAPFQGKIDSIAFQAADAANVMMFINDGLTVLVIGNAHTGPVQVTVVSVPDEATRSGDITLTVPAGGTGFVRPLRPQWWNQRSGADAGNVYVNFEIDTAITVAAIRQHP